MAPAVARDSLREMNAVRITLVLGAAVGLASFAFYYTLGLTTAHYDAKAHLVVARRITDSVQPGYTQMGIHWLPLIHLIYIPLVVLDGQYRSALLPSLVSVTAFVLSAGLVCRITSRMTGSSKAGLFSGLLFIANPNLHYLQSCPLTEPLYILLLLLAVDSVTSWREGEKLSLPWLAALWLGLGSLCRYEGWCVAAGIILLLIWDLYARYTPRRTAAKAIVLSAIAFALPVLAHFGYLYVRVGDSFLHRVVRGNPAPYETFQRPFLSLAYHLGELAQISAVVPLLIGLVGTGYCLRRCRPLARWVPLFLLWLPSLVNVSALYWGMIYRVRYSAIIVPALAIFSGILSTSTVALRRTAVAACLAAMMLPWLCWYFPEEWKYRFFFPGPGLLWVPVCALICFLLAQGGVGWRGPLLALAVLGLHIPVLEGENRPILSETLEHRFVEGERLALLTYLRENYDRTRILVDMERQAPLVYDSHLRVKEFIYAEGGLHWERAIHAPWREVGWIIIEKDDQLWQLLQVAPHWADRYSLAVHTENFLMYRLRSEGRERLLPARRLE